MILSLVPFVVASMLGAPPGVTQQSEFIELEAVRASAGWEQAALPDASGGKALRCGPTAQPLRLKLRLRADGTHRVWLHLAGPAQATVQASVTEKGLPDQTVRFTVPGGTAGPAGRSVGATGRSPLQWRSADVKLSHGNAFLVLQPAPGATLDCVLVTPALDYQPNPADFALPTDRMERLETALTQVFVYGYVLTALLYLVFFFQRRRALGQFATACLAICAVANLVAIVVRTARGHQLPLGSGWEFAMCFSFGIAGAYFIVERVRGTKLLGAFALLLVCGVCLYGYTAFEDKGIRGLMPALRNPFWLSVHVAMAIVAYGGLAISCCTAVAHLARLWADGGLEARPTEGEPAGLRAWMRANLPTAEFLERTIYQIVGFSFPFLTLLIITGAVWAQTAWGRWWGWDPKETSAFVAWLVYLAYLHSRLEARWRGRTSSIIAVLGFLAIIICYVGVNFLPGLHSYGGQ